MSDFSDPSDTATKNEIEELERRIAAARGVVAQPRPMPEFCENDCGEVPRERSRYCSEDCRCDHELRQRIEKRRVAR